VTPMSPSTAVGLGHTEGLACSPVTPQGCGWVEASAPVPADAIPRHQRVGGHGAWHARPGATQCDIPQHGWRQARQHAQTPYVALEVEAGAPSPASTIPASRTLAWDRRRWPRQARLHPQAPDAALGFEAGAPALAGTTPAQRGVARRGAAQRSAARVEAGALAPANTIRSAGCEAGAPAPVGAMPGT
jgi:hypothetical protein